MKTAPSEGLFMKGCLHRNNNYMVMEFSHHIFSNHPECSVQVSSFTPPSGERTEHHMIFQFSRQHDNPGADTGTDCIAVLHSCMQEWLSSDPYRDSERVFARYFLKDASVQRSRIHTREVFPPACAISCIEQPPANKTGLAVWVYLKDKGHTSDRYIHYWTTEKFCLAGNVTQQTRKLLMDYQQWLHIKGCNMKDHCLRTWFFIKDIDANYSAFAKSRTEYFEEIGMDKDTHYIASTGIEGSNGAPASYVTMDAYAVSGLEPDRITYLRGLTHLSPTNIYGVTFERGVALRFDDRTQILISGTASIDQWGNVMHLDDIKSQTLRMWKNVEVLLHEAGSGYEDVAQIIVYLRRQEDYELVDDLFRSRFPSIPTLIVMGRVCRPTWLIEMECIAITHA